MQIATQAVVYYTTCQQAKLDAMTDFSTQITCHQMPATITTPDPASPGLPVTHLASEADPSWTTVVVVTSAGDFQVDVVRTGQYQRWMVFNITEPAG